MNQVEVDSIAAAAVPERGTKSTAASASATTSTMTTTTATSTRRNRTNEEEKTKESSTGDGALSSFLAKDGIYYSSYMEQRAANIRHNEEKLKSVGLGGSYHRLASSNKKKSPARKRSWIIATTATDDDENDDNDTIALRRKSGRIRQQRVSPPQSSVSPTVTSRNSTSSTNTTNPKLLPELDDDHQNHCTKKLRNRKFRRIPSVTGHSNSSTSTTSTTMTSTTTLTIKDHQILRQFEISKPLWMEDMELYLKQVEQLSYPNYRNVMRQVGRFMSGTTGITYKHWDDNVAFRAQSPISLSDDMDDLYDEALEFELEHGRDLGNGTLMCVCAVCVFLH